MNDFLRWNDAIAEHFFRGEDAGKTVYLYVTRDVIEEIGGVGMEFVSHELGYAVAKALIGRGILISGTYINAKVLRVEPPLVIPYPELDKFLAALEASVEEVSKAG